MVAKQQFSDGSINSYPQNNQPKCVINEVDIINFLYPEKILVCAKQKTKKKRKKKRFHPSLFESIIDALSTTADVLANQILSESDAESVLDHSTIIEHDTVETYNPSFLDHFVDSIGPMMPLGAGLPEHIGSGSDISMAFMPPFLSMISFESPPGPVAKKMWHRYFLSSTAVQGASGVCQFFLFGDHVSGLMDMVMAGLGAYSVTSEDGAQYLPAYVFSSGLNGVVSAIYLFGRMSSPLPLFSIHYPFLLNLAHLVLFAKPIILFSSAYTGYKFIKNCQQSYMVRQGDAPEEEASFLSDVVVSVVRPTQILAEKTFKPFSGSGYTLGSYLNSNNAANGNGEEEVDEFRADEAVDEGTNNAN